MPSLRISIIDSFTFFLICGMEKRRDTNFEIIVVRAIGLYSQNMHVHFGANWSSRFQNIMDTVLNNAISRKTCLKRVLPLHSLMRILE